jgi:hypothetical protein
MGASVKKISNLKKKKKKINSGISGIPGISGEVSSMTYSPRDTVTADYALNGWRKALSINTRLNVLEV